MCYVNDFIFFLIFPVKTLISPFSPSIYTKIEVWCGVTSFSDWTAAHWMTRETGFLAMYWAWTSVSDFTSSMMWPASNIYIRNRNDDDDDELRKLTMLVSKLHGSVDSSAFLGDVQLDVELLLHHVITTNMFSFNSGRCQQASCEIANS